MTTLEAVHAMAGATLTPCARALAEGRDLWLSDDPAERLEAARACPACPLFGPCREAALAMPMADARKMGAVLGGVDLAQATARRRRAAWCTCGCRTEANHPLVLGRPGPCRNSGTVCTCVRFAGCTVQPDLTKRRPGPPKGVPRPPRRSACSYCSCPAKAHDPDSYDLCTACIDCTGYKTKVAA